MSSALKSGLRRQWGGQQTLPKKPTFPPPHLIFWQQLRHQDASGMDSEEKEEMDNIEGEPWNPRSLPGSPLPPRTPR